MGHCSGVSIPVRCKIGGFIQTPVIELMMVLDAVFPKGGLGSGLSTQVEPTQCKIQNADRKT
jgi:hypothetical protein